MTLVGPSDVIAQMRQPAYRPKPRARVDVSESDLPAGQTRIKQVQFDDLPAGVTVGAEDAKRTVEVRIEAVK